MLLVYQQYRMERKVLLWISLFLTRCDVNGSYFICKTGKYHLNPWLEYVCLCFVPTLCVTPVSVCSFPKIYLPIYDRVEPQTHPRFFPSHAHIHFHISRVYVYEHIYIWTGVQQTNTPNHAYHSSLVCNLTLKASKRKRALCQSHPVPPLLLSLLHFHTTCVAKKFFPCLTVSHSKFFYFLATPRLIPF